MPRTLITLGIDEAGRGPILGPLVMAGVWVPREKEHILAEYLLKPGGIRDSKVFGSGVQGKKIRSELAEKIKTDFLFSLISLSSKTVDDYVKDKRLNYLEQETALKIIHRYSADKVVLDGQNLFKKICESNMVAENRADQKYLSVAAASILAKDLRDQQFASLCQPFKKGFGTISGGGYPNRRTLKFVTWYLEKFKALPDFYRKSYNWSLLNPP
jgi:ribonuclease HII